MSSALRRPKISVIGAGTVGAGCAYRIAARDLGEVVLVNRTGDRARGKALDVLQAAPNAGFSCRVNGTDDFALTRDSDVVVIAAGTFFVPGMTSRQALFEPNAMVVRECALQVARHSPKAILILVTNPVDSLCHIVREATGFPRSRIIGMGGTMDSARFRSFIATALEASVQDVQGIVIGAHHLTMVPLWRQARVAGIPLEKLMSRERIEKLLQQTRFGGRDQRILLGDGPNCFGPAEATAELVEALVRDQKRILPCSVWLEGEYGLQNVFCGVVAKLGLGGVESLPALDLNDEELQALRESAKSVQELLPPAAPA